MSNSDLITGLPGQALVRQGLKEAQSGQCTVAACLVEMARPRLEQCGLIEPNAGGRFPEPELKLYDLLRRQGGDAYSRYNSLLRELVPLSRPWTGVPAWLVVCRIP